MCVRVHVRVVCVGVDEGVQRRRPLHPLTPPLNPLTPLHYTPLHPSTTPPYLAVDGLESHQELLQRREELGRLLGSAIRAISAVSAIRAISAVSAASLASLVSLVSDYLVRARSAP